MNRKFGKEAKEFCEAIRTLAEHPDRLENMETYLSMHFEAWLERHADTPGGIAYEMRSFAEME